VARLSAHHCGEYGNSLDDPQCCNAFARARRCRRYCRSVTNLAPMVLGRCPTTIVCPKAAPKRWMRLGVGLGSGNDKAGNSRKLWLSRLYWFAHILRTRSSIQPNRAAPRAGTLGVARGGTAPKRSAAADQQGLRPCRVSGAPFAPASRFGSLGIVQCIVGWYLKSTLL